MSIHACWCHPITNAGNVLPQVWNQDNNDYVRYKSNGTSIFSISSKEHFQISNWRRVHCAVQAWGWVELLRGSVAILVSTRMQRDLKSQTFVKQNVSCPCWDSAILPICLPKIISISLFICQQKNISRSSFFTFSSSVSTLLRCAGISQRSLSLTDWGMVSQITSSIQSLKQ